MNNYNKILRKRIQDIHNRLKDSYYKELVSLDCSAYVTKEPLSYDQRTQGELVELKEGEKWGELFDCAWFHLTGVVPKEAKGLKVVLLIDINGEGCIYNNQGEPILGLTCGSNVFQHESCRKRMVPVCDISEGNEIIDIWMDAGNNDLFGRFIGNGSIVQMQIAIADDLLRDLYYDIAVLDNILDNIDDNSPRFYSILHTMDRAINGLDLDSADSIMETRAILKELYDKKGGDPSLKINALGHAHIDLAWLWPIRETIRKCARTFSTALALMDKYPDYKFGASQPQIYEWMKQLYPALYQRIKEKIHEGRWEVQGAMWVEADTNLSGGEALVRQLLYGTRFYQDEFGIDVNNLWLPDVFGYSGALPQILKKSNIPYFMTIKLSWNRINDFPYHTFVWRGIDGSDILCHMPPEGNYNSLADASSLVQARDNFKEKGLSDEVLMLYGVGNGGGGPAALHQEGLNRLSNFQGLPPVKQDFAANFFDRINRNRDRYPSWTGELYLEFHQGTYTTQAKNKKYNRKLEYLLREAEFACVMAMKYADAIYPQQELETIWKEVLLYQFHDILPGSSIKRVYDESVQRYGVLTEQVNSIVNNAYSHITQDSNESHVLFNSLTWDRHGFTKINNNWSEYSVASLANINISATPNTADYDGIILGDDCIENEFIKVTFAQNGNISSIYDKENGRENIQHSKSANILAVYNDTKDAWDMDVRYSQRDAKQFDLIATNKYIDGPKVVFEHKYKYNKSTLTQMVSLTKSSKYVSFDTHVDWHESEKMLRTSFPISVNSDNATCNIQFGSIKRPTHTNTSWDLAKYEISAHKWVDISEENYGVALLNDCKYGYKVQGNVLDLNLLRSTSHPGEDADQGEHSFSYAIYPHIGNCYDANVEKYAMEFNIEPTIINNAITNISANSFINCDNDNIVIETIKKCEDSNSIIVRMYESVGAFTKASVSVPSFCTNVKLTNLMEQDINDVALYDNSINLEFKPFEIMTIKLI